MAPPAAADRGCAHRPRLAQACALGTAAGVIVVDQATKTWAQAYLHGGAVPIVGPLRFQLTYNSGVAFSIGEGHPAVVVVLAAALIGGLVWAVAKPQPMGSVIGLGLILGGALGNLADRLFRPLGGAVVDFIATGFWPTFNLADASIVVGCGLVLVELLRNR